MVTRELRRNLDHKLSPVSVNLNYISSNFKLLILDIHNAKDLLKKDVFGLSDPYVRVRFWGTDEYNLYVLSPSTTSTVKRTLSPVWNEKLYFLVSASQFTVALDIFDENILTRDDHLGRVLLHFDFISSNLNSGLLQTVQQPTVIQSAPNHVGWLSELSTPLTGLQIHQKYSPGICRDLERLWQLQYLNDYIPQYKHKASYSNTPKYIAKGSLNVSYCFLNPEMEQAVRLMQEIGVKVTPKSTITHLHRHDNETVTSSSSSLPYPTELNPHQATPNPNPQPEPNLAVALGFEVVSQEDANESSSDEEDSLPNGWERRVDSNGRRVFFNHLSRSASLRRPNQRVANNEHQNRNYLPRLDSIEVIESDSDDEEEAEEQPPSHDLAENVTIPSAPPLPVSQLEEETNSNSVSSAIHMLEPAEIFENTEISEAPAEPERPTLTPQQLKIQKLRIGLPPGWDVAITDDGKTYYLDHVNKKTLWDRPKVHERKPLRQERGKQSEPVEQGGLPPGWEARKAADGRIFYVNHTTKTTQWAHPLKKDNSDLGPLPRGWELKQRSDGKIFFIDHNTKSTQWEDPRLLAKNKPTHQMQYSRDYKQKYSNFMSQLVKPTNRQPPQFKIPVKRDRILEDSYNVIMSSTPEKMKGRIWVEFEGEYGLDYGGVAREWFHLLSHAMFNPYYGLFEYSASDDYTLQINPDSGIYNENHLDYFKFIGRVCGMAIYHKRLIDAFFIRPFYKMILSRQVTLKDMESVDIELYNSIQYIQENDPEPLCLTFSINKTVFGEIIEEELKPGGQDIEVTESNKKEYIDLMIKWRFTQRVAKQMSAFRNGLSDLVPLHYLRVFDERELEYLLGGLSAIDVADWKKNTEYSGYIATDSVIVWFWKAVENFDDEMRARLLQFVTGTSKVPMNGFRELQGSNGPRMFCIKKYGGPNDLPRAHTCFNRIDLPAYHSYHKVKENLKLAIENTEGFEGVD